MAFYFRGGAIYESAATNGICHLIEHLFFRKLGELEQYDIYKKVNKIGAIFKGCTYRDFIRMDITVSNSFVMEAVEILSMIMSDFYWHEDDVLLEKEVVKNQIKFRSDSYHDFIRRQYFKQTKAAATIMGTIQSLEKMDAPLVNRWKRKIFNPQNASFVVCGNIEKELEICIINKLEQISCSSRTIVPHYIQPKRFCDRDLRQDRIFNIDGDTADISVIFDIGNDVFVPYAVDVLCSIIGQGDGSILSMFLREKLSYTDEVIAYIEEDFQCSRMVFELTLSNHNTINCLRKMVKMINDTKKDIPCEVLDENISFFTQNKRWLYDSPRELNFWMAWQSFVLQKDFSGLEDEIDRYLAISIEQLLETARKLFVSKNMTIMLSNNSKIIKRPVLQNELEHLRDLLDS